MHLHSCLSTGRKCSLFLPELHSGKQQVSDCSVTIGHPTKYDFSSATLSVCRLLPLVNV